MRAGGRRGRVEGVLAVRIHLSEDPRAVPGGYVGLHGFSDAFDAMSGPGEASVTTGRKVVGYMLVGEGGKILAEDLAKIVTEISTG